MDDNLDIVLTYVDFHSPGNGIARLARTPGNFVSGILFFAAKLKWTWGGR